jgi:hypothetical protein
MPKESSGRTSRKREGAAANPQSNRPKGKESLRDCGKKSGLYASADWDGGKSDGRMGSSDYYPRLLNYAWQDQIAGNTNSTIGGQGNV